METKSNKKYLCFWTSDESPEKRLIRLYSKTKSRVNDAIFMPSLGFMRAAEVRRQIDELIAEKIALQKKVRMLQEQVARDAVKLVNLAAEQSKVGPV